MPSPLPRPFLFPVFGSAARFIDEFISITLFNSPKSVFVLDRLDVLVGLLRQFVLFGHRQLAGAGQPGIDLLGCSSASWILFLIIAQRLRRMSEALASREVLPPFVSSTRRLSAVFGWDEVLAAVIDCTPRRSLGAGQVDFVSAALLAAVSAFQEKVPSFAGTVMVAEPFARGSPSHVLPPTMIETSGGNGLVFLSR